MALLSRFVLIIGLILASVQLACCIPHAKPDPKIWNKGHRFGRGSQRGSPGVKRQTSGSSCAAANQTGIAAPLPNAFNVLSGPEVAGVATWLFNQSDFNLTVTADAGEWDNTVRNIELLIPNKTDVLRYLDGDGNAPARYAHVTLAMDADEDGYIQEIVVGPLPIQNDTVNWMPLEFPYTRKTSGKIRDLEANYDTRQDWIWDITENVTDITQDLFNISVGGHHNDTGTVWGNDPYWQDDGRVLSWYTFVIDPTGDFDSSTLLPTGLFFQVDVTGRNPDGWSFLGWFYNNIMYNTTEDFRNAWQSEGFEKIPANKDGTYGSTDQEGQVLPLDTQPPPQQVAPGGTRFNVDTEQKYVKWMDFEFYMSFSLATGLSIYDIRYKGERIIYELGLQEALAHYAANDPYQSGTSYLDSYYGFGPYTFQLVNGYDCPTYSTYLNTSYYYHEETHTHLNSICLFESDAGYPIQRHSTHSYVSATRNIVFTVRTVATVGNYDYMFSYEFYMDGSINVEVRASGYIQSTSSANNEDYGFKITSDSLSGSMHDHVLNFKLDFDIKGTNNTLDLVSVVPHTQVYPWSNGKPRNTMKLSRSSIETEDDGKINWDGQTQYIVGNKDMPNEGTGETPGYRILPSGGTAHLAVINSTNLGNAATWATNDLFVTKQKDTEPRSAYRFNNQDINDPMINFDNFFNGENLTQTDLVLWFNLGMHHVPHTGDLPNTVFTAAQSSIMLTPHNYLPTNPSRETIQMVRLEYGNGEQTNITSFGQDDVGTLEQCLGADTISQQAINVNLQEYLGGVVVRKFPYEPDDPYTDT